MFRKSLRSTAVLSVLITLLALALLGGATYAWITFRTFSTVEPMAGTFSGGEGDLLIANNPNGPFDIHCDLLLNRANAELLPVTTADLGHFYAASISDGLGRAVLYRGADTDAQEHTLSGSVYLRATGNAMRIFLWLPSVSCGNDAQTLAAMRLGLRFNTAAGVQAHIFRVDSLGNTQDVQAQQTVMEAGMVVASIDGDGRPTYTADPAKDLQECGATGTAEAVRPGTTALCTIGSGETVRVDYWLYLEGCDEHCINSAQGRDIALQLGFAGTN